MASRAPVACDDLVILSQERALATPNFRSAAPSPMPRNASLFGRLSSRTGAQVSCCSDRRRGCDPLDRGQRCRPESALAVVSSSIALASCTLKFVSHWSSPSASPPPTTANGALFAGWSLPPRDAITERIERRSASADRCWRLLEHIATFGYELHGSVGINGPVRNENRSRACIEDRTGSPESASRRRRRSLQLEGCRQVAAIRCRRLQRR